MLNDLLYSNEKNKETNQELFKYLEPCKTSRINYIFKVDNDNHVFPNNQYPWDIVPELEIFEKSFRSITYPNVLKGIMRLMR